MVIRIIFPKAFDLKEFESYCCNGVSRRQAKDREKAVCVKVLTWPKKDRESVWETQRAGLCRHISEER